MSAPALPPYHPPTEPYLSVLHEDGDILVLDKQSGLLTVPGKAPGAEDCLEARARTAFPSARIVHRLDMETSGVIVLALNAKAHRHLGLQFERRHTQKTYVARVWGEVEGPSGRVDLPLRCDWPNRPRQMVDEAQGKPARTRWEVAAREEGPHPVTRMALFPETGRSHQLRVHMLALGHPILGDRLYAPPEIVAAAARLQLHAEALTLRHPADGRAVTFRALCPF